MHAARSVLWLLFGLGVGVAATTFAIGQTVRRSALTDPNLLLAGSNDRYEDYAMCTGAVALTPRAPTDGLWILDYRAGKLLGTVIDRNQGRITGFAEVNLVQDFQIPPKQNVHFMMTTGMIAAGQSALYVVETTTGKFGIYTLGPDPTNPQAGIIIRRHDMGYFRQPERQ